MLAMKISTDINAKQVRQKRSKKDSKVYRDPDFRQLHHIDLKKRTHFFRPTDQRRSFSCSELRTGLGPRTSELPRLRHSGSPVPPQTLREKMRSSLLLGLGSAVLSVEDPLGSEDRVDLTNMRSEGLF